ncbi:unnamed protein product [Moneuplotes crassus]|uniref:Uncharacterized protein n=1 Tax=Euplotes crassus TaxID=5936 RepID=A0AAD1XKG5_EUPCR|nr:unnamed protein product [Moneuplotes crassus]
MSNLSFSLHPTKVVTHNSISQNNSKTSIPLHSTPQHMEKTNIKAEKGGQEELNKEQINYHFYKEFCRLTIARDILKREIESCKSQIEAFKNKDSQEKLIESINNISDNCSHKERRKRRTAVKLRGNIDEDIEVVINPMAQKEVSTSICKISIQSSIKNSLRLCILVIFQSKVLRNMNICFPPLLASLKRKEMKKKKRKLRKIVHYQILKISFTQKEK